MLLLPLLSDSLIFGSSMQISREDFFSSDLVFVLRDFFLFVDSNSSFAGLRLDAGALGFC